jgi:hypothetical protein
MIYVRQDTRHASYANERRAHEIGLMLEFLESRLRAR